MRFGKYEILRDGETAVLMLVGENKKTKEETLKPIAYTRDLLGALQSMQRKMSVDEFSAEPDAKRLMKLIEKNQDELVDLVKSKCRECLK